MRRAGRGQGPGGRLPVWLAELACCALMLYAVMPVQRGGARPALAGARDAQAACSGPHDLIVEHGGAVTLGEGSFVFDHVCVGGTLFSRALLDLRAATISVAAGGRIAVGTVAASVPPDPHRRLRLRAGLLVVARGGRISADGADGFVAYTHDCVGVNAAYYPSGFAGATLAIDADQAVIQGDVTADGGAGIAYSSPDKCGAPAVGGGGHGGSIVLRAVQLTLGGRISAAGGSGGASSSNIPCLAAQGTSGPGGTGGAGGSIMVAAARPDARALRGRVVVFGGRAGSCGPGAQGRAGAPGTASIRVLTPEERAALGALATPVPAPVAKPGNALAVAAGSAHSLAVGSDGAVWAWGFNNVGQLGVGDTDNRRAPVRVPDLPPVATIAAGADHSLALGRDGSVWAWGENRNGELGVGDTRRRHAPVRVVGLPPAMAVAGGFDHSLALGRDGTVWAWGDNLNGELGDGTAGYGLHPVPARVPGLPPVVAIAAGGGTSFAVGRDGSVWAWGQNGYGQLGVGDTRERHTPVRVGGLPPIAAIAAGEAGTLALGRDGSVWAWGLNNNGQLGVGDARPHYSPARVLGLPPVGAIATDGDSFALGRDGAIWEWGYGEGGNGGTSGSGVGVPARVGGLPPISGIATGVGFALAVARNGAIWAWGANDDGQLGTGDIAPRSAPVLVSGLPSAPTPTPTPTPTPVPHQGVASTASWHRKHQARG